VMTSRRLGEIESVQMIMTPNGELYTLWSETRAEERQTWIAHHLPNYMLEIEEAGSYL